MTLTRRHENNERESALFTFAIAYSHFFFARLLLQCSELASEAAGAKLFFSVESSEVVGDEVVVHG